MSSKIKKIQHLNLEAIEKIEELFRESSPENPLTIDQMRNLLYVKNVLELNLVHGCEKLNMEQ